ncbi:MAG: hypothetical protein HYV04_21175 [Deltaproteobacteria bacterium]|nr:hypothetical protein [Deltaproteobacteria bacterium]
MKLIPPAVKGFVRAWGRATFEITIVNHEGEIGPVEILYQVSELRLLLGVVLEIPNQAKCKSGGLDPRSRLENTAAR